MNKDMMKGRRGGSAQRLFAGLLVWGLVSSASDRLCAQTSVLPTGDYASADGTISIAAHGVPYQVISVGIYRDNGYYELILDGGWYVNGNTPTRRAAFFQINGNWYYSFDKMEGGVWVDDGWGQL